MISMNSMLLSFSQAWGIVKSSNASLEPSRGPYLEKEEMTRFQYIAAMSAQIWHTLFSMAYDEACSEWCFYALMLLLCLRSCRPIRSVLMHCSMARPVGMLLKQHEPF